MDNLIHASATPSDAEREIKLWFIPLDIPPSMRPYPTEVNEDYYFVIEWQTLSNLYREYLEKVVAES